MFLASRRPYADSRTVDLLNDAGHASSSTATSPHADLDVLERSLVSVTEMLDRVLTYVRAVLSGERKGDPAVGRYLMDALGASTDDLEKGGFNTSLQVRFCFCLDDLFAHIIFYRTH